MAAAKKSAAAAKTSSADVPVASAEESSSTTVDQMAGTLNSIEVASDPNEQSPSDPIVVVDPALAPTEAATPASVPGTEPELPSSPQMLSIEEARAVRADNQAAIAAAQTNHDTAPETVKPKSEEDPMPDSSDPKSRDGSEFPAADAADEGSFGTYVVWSCGSLKVDGHTLAASSVHSVPDWIAKNIPCLRKLADVEHADGELTTVGRHVEAAIQSRTASGEGFDIAELLDQACRQLLPRPPQE